jgi:hypothetical protein
MNRASIALLLAQSPNSGNRICVTCCEEKYFEKLAYFQGSKSVSSETTKTPQMNHEKATQNHQKNTHFSQNPCKNAIPRCT